MKLHQVDGDAADDLVAPHAGAWIEITKRQCCADGAFEVAPTRGRGLKYFYQLLCLKLNIVAPTRGRGLKLHLTFVERSLLFVAPTRGRGLKLRLRRENFIYAWSPPRGGVD